ncbi:MAG: polysaccharide deacetylase family protein [Planctomycetota bacterium]
MILTLAICAAALFAAVVLLPLLVRAVQRSRLRRLCRGRLVLSYDDGPGLSATPKLLDLLDRHGVKASFYVTGFRAEAAHRVCDRLVASGHELGTHTHGHVSAWKVSPWRAVRELDDGYDRLTRWIEPDAPFRPPFGRLTTWTWLAARRRGARVSWWTVDSGDSFPAPPDPESVTRRVVDEGGAVVLMHCHDRADVHNEYMLDLTARLIEAARRNGLEICTHAQLFDDREQALRGGNGGGRG